MGFALFLDSLTTGPLREAFAEVGVLSPVPRGLILTGFYLLFLFTIRPSRNFDHDGNPLPWILYNPNPRQVSTWLPWWLEAMLFAVSSILFI